MGVRHELVVGAVRQLRPSGGLHLHVQLLRHPLQVELTIRAFQTHARGGLVETELRQLRLRVDVAVAEKILHILDIDGGNHNLRETVKRNGLRRRLGTRGAPGREDNSNPGSEHTFPKQSRLKGADLTRQKNSE